jgi:hypothetical protein
LWDNNGVCLAVFLKNILFLNEMQRELCFCGEELLPSRSTAGAGVKTFSL